ncbi:hypothetical protein, partial [Ferruginibacter sp.]|uniref:hypothetical protein n=1 Tax=Ferruginibacter sp. TaxID=1940288 RepID=UPI0026586AF6
QMANDINRHSSLKNRDWQIACNEIKNKLQGEKNFFKPQFLVFAQSDDDAMKNKCLSQNNITRQLL